MKRWGRSPRARSSPTQIIHRDVDCGSISACAEQPRLRDACDSWRRVDLRVRGAAGGFRWRAPSSQGRSPRARSSRDRQEEARRLQGSISACAEQPARIDTSRGCVEVDLRVRGAAVSRFVMPATV